MFTIDLKQQGYWKDIHGFYNSLKAFADFIIKFRYLIALVVFVLLVLLKINGSNIGCWSQYVDEGGKTTVVAGHAQPVRSDEWTVLIPNDLSQQNSDEPFSVNNKSVTMSGQNMILTLDAPVMDIYTICHPQNWGFLFLSADYALSWYWDLKQILILLLAFELAMILTKRHKYLSMLGAIWIALSPAVQWWFAQHVGNNVLFFEAMVVTFYYFLKFHDRLPLKATFAFLFSLSCLGFVMPFYPPIQIPFGFLALILFVLIFTDFKKNIKFNMTDVIVVSAAAIFTAAMLVHLYLIIKNAIPQMSNTVYPGSRVSHGGGARDFYFYAYLTNLLYPYTRVSVVNANACELSSFYNFLPAVLLTLPMLIKRRAKSIKYGIALAAFSVFFALYMTWAFVPTIIAKITLLSYVPGPRAMLSYSFAAMLLSIWAFGEFIRSGGFGRVYSAAVSAGIMITYVLAYKFTNLAGSSRVRYVVVVIVGFTILNYLFLRAHKKTFTVGMACLILASGLAINPINIGAGAILDNKLSNEIRTIDKKDGNAVWMADDTNTAATMSIFIYANGAHSSGGINNCPDMKKWALLDPQRKYAFIYNRSAHVAFQLVKTKTNFVLTSLATFRVDINVHDIKKLNIKYIVSNRDLTTMSDASVAFTPLYPRDGMNDTIYQVSYTNSK